MDVICVLFLSCSPLKRSFVSVVFDFNASLNDVAPLPSILLPIDLIRMKKSGLFMGVICVLVLSSHFKSSFASVLFNINASHNDVAPASPMSLSVFYVKKVIVTHIYFHRCSFFMNTTQNESLECCICLQCITK